MTDVTRPSREEITPMSVLFAEMLIEIESLGGWATRPTQELLTFFEARVTERFSKEDDALYLVKRGDDGELIAALEAGIYTRGTPLRAESYLHLHMVYVVPDHRRQGIARALVEQALTWGREKGCHEVELNVVPGNPAAKLYERLGFGVIQQRMSREI